jgi:hypothetical protein
VSPEAQAGRPATPARPPGRRWGPVCRVCNGTGGGDDPHLRCPTCEGTGFLQPTPPEREPVEDLISCGRFDAEILDAAGLTVAAKRIRALAAALEAERERVRGLETRLADASGALRATEAEVLQEVARTEAEREARRTERETVDAGLRVLADEHLSAETCWRIARDLLGRRWP